MEHTDVLLTSLSSPEVWVMLQQRLQVVLDVSLVLQTNDGAQVFPHRVQPLHTGILQAEEAA